MTWRDRTLINIEAKIYSNEEQKKEVRCL